MLPGGEDNQNVDSVSTISFQTPITTTMTPAHNGTYARPFNVAYCRLWSVLGNQRGLWYVLVGGVNRIVEWRCVVSAWAV